jgi:O-antigen/teichoic acid export membrane protein
MIAIGAASIVGVIIALAGGGAWAIVIQLLVADSVSSVLVWRFCPWRPRFIYSFSSLRDLGPFGAKTMGTRFLWYLRLNTDNLLIGRYLGSRPLGIYSLAYNLMFAPVTRIAQPVQQVLFPAFSRLQGDPVRLGRAWLQGNRLLAALTIPAFLGMAVVGPDFVPVVLGRRWDNAVPVLQLLSLSGVVMSFEQLNGSVLQGLGRPGMMLKYMLFSTAVIVIAFALGVQWGVVGVAALYLAASAALAPIFAWITVRAVGISVSDFLRSVVGVVEASMAMGIVVYGARVLLIYANFPAGGRVAVLVPFGLAFYVAYVAWRTPALLTEARNLRSGA